MGSDQVEGIVTIGGQANRADPPPAQGGHDESCNCPRAPGACCPKRLHPSADAFSYHNNTTSNEVRFQNIQCDCHCITCCYKTPVNSSRSIDDSALPPGLLTEDDATTDDPATDERTEHNSNNVSIADLSPIAAVCPYALRQSAAPPQAPRSLGTDDPPVGSFATNNSFPAAITPEEECVRVYAPGPCARYGHSLTEFSPGHFLLFGGTDSTTSFNDLFVLIRGHRGPSRCGGSHSGVGACPVAAPQGNVRSSWTELRPLISAPSPRFGHSCHLHHDKKTLIFFGGTDHQTWFNDMYALPLQPTGISRTFEKIERDVPHAHAIPCARRGHTLVPYKDGTCVLYGGHSRVSLSDTWVLEADLTWRELPTVGCVPSCPFDKTPESRYGHTAVVYHKRMYVYGGFCATGPAEPNVWSLDLETHIWRAVDTAVGITEGPGRRFGHTASLVGCRMVIFGGMDGFPSGRSLNDAFQLNIETLEWTKLLVAGGGDAGNDLPSTSTSACIPEPDEINGSSGVRMLLGPQGRRSHAAALDSSGARVVIFGGWGDCAVQHDNCCLEMELSPPTLREIARNWIGSKVVYRREADTFES